MKVLIRGAGDLASGIALRLSHAGFLVAMTETAVPTTVRRTVAFSPAVYEGQAVVEDRKALRCTSYEEVKAAWEQGYLAVLVDEKASIRAVMNPDVLVDAILAKYNCGTQKTDAPTVIGVGPGFTAGVDCHCVIETRRGHDLGRCIWQGSAQPNTGIPGNIGGYTAERILRAPCDGVFHGLVSIGAKVTAGEVVGEVNQTPMCSQISGVVRGLLQDGVVVHQGMKSGDVDPRDVSAYCHTVSDKARAIGGGVLEAILQHSGILAAERTACSHE